MEDEEADYGQEEFAYDISSTKSKPINEMKSESKILTNEDEYKTVKNSTKIINDSYYQISENTESDRKESENRPFPRSLARTITVKKRLSNQYDKNKNIISSDTKNESFRKDTIEENIKKYFNSNKTKEDTEIFEDTIDRNNSQQFISQSNKKNSNLKLSQVNSSKITLSSTKQVIGHINLTEGNIHKVSDKNKLEIEPINEFNINSSTKIKFNSNSIVLPDISRNNNRNMIIKEKSTINKKYKPPHPKGLDKFNNIVTIKQPSKKRPFSYSNSKSCEKKVESYLSQEEKEKNDHVRKEIKSLERTNCELREKLVLLNFELNKLIDKFIHDQRRKDVHSNVLNNEQVLNKEIENSNKILSGLVNQYNSAFKKFYTISDPEYIKNLKNTLVEYDKQIIELQNQNKKISQRNKLNEVELNKSHKNNEKLPEHSNFYFKFQYYQENTEKNKIEIDKLNKQIENEEEFTKNSIFKHNKLIEIFNNYEKDAPTLEVNNKSNIITNENETKKINLVKKVRILEHSRQTQQKSFLNEKENKKKIIQHLEKELHKLQEELHEKFILKFN